MTKQITGRSTVIDNDKTVGMVEREFYMLSNFSAHQVELDGFIYPTLEHAYHSERFEDDDIKTEIRSAISPMQAKEISWKYKQDNQLVDWDDKKASVMKKLCRLKLMQHQDVKDALLRTGDRQIVEDISSEYYWGTGEDGTGENVLGKIWMELREKLSQSWN